MAVEQGLRGRRLARGLGILAQEGHEIGHLLIGQAQRDSVWHDRHGLLLARGNVGARDRVATPLCVLDDHRVAVGQDEAAVHLFFRGFEQPRVIAEGDGRTRFQDGSQQLLRAVLAAHRTQVRSDLTTAAMEDMA